MKFISQVACVTATCLVLPAPALLAADDESAPLASATPACLAGHEEGQLLLNKGRLRDAAAAFLRCTDDACPAAVRADCIALRERVATTQPTIVVSARRGSGATATDVVDARLLIDGQLMTNRLDGRVLAVDPGPHALRIDVKGVPPQERAVVISPGEKQRLFVFEIPEPEPRASATRVPALIAAGAGGLALASFATFAIIGRSQQSCRGHCTQGEVDSLRRSYLIADVSLATAVVALGAAAWLWWRPTAPEPSRTVAAPTPYIALPQEAGKVSLLFGARGAF